MLIAPVDGSNAHSRTPTFVWHEVGGAEEYQIQIDDEPDFSSPEKDGVIESTDYIPTPELSAGAYYWRVRASSSSEVGDWSEPWAFTALALSPPEFKLYLPVVTRGYR